ncbi:MAG: hypothetical protein GWN58_07995, partial [Anaerolineae bacterium]|nr:hypothetical protein [Anaerolineae bacterium]
ITGKQVSLRRPGHHAPLDLNVGDLVEVVDDDLVLQGQVEPLRQVVGIDAEEARITLNAPPATARDDRAKHPLLRRWDHAADPAAPHGLHLDEPSGSAKVWAGDGSSHGHSTWHLEDGVHVEFCQPGDSDF